MNWTASLPEIVLACCAMAILIFGVVRSGPARPTFLVCSMLAVGALIVVALMELGAARGLAFHGMISADPFSRFAKVLILLGSAFGLVLSLDYDKEHGLSRFEFPVLILLATVGMMVMVSAQSFMSLYLGLELQSLALYVLAASARDELRSAEAGLKYFVLGALASGLLLYGITLVYGFGGTMDFARLAGAFTDADHVSTGLVVGVVFVIAGLAFKLSAVPFHMWTPDVYEGAPTPITGFLSTAPKVAAIVLLTRVMFTPFGHLVGQWQGLIELVSIGSMLLGSLAAIGQTNIKRLMAYSSIGHVGYALIGLAAGTQSGARGVLIYMVTYVLMSAGTFACIIAMKRRGLSLEKISDLGGLGRTDPGLALALTVFMFSMAGIPPFSGFIGKFFVFQAAVESGLWPLAVIGVLTSVIGAYYYLRIIKVMYVDAPEPAFDHRPASLSFVAGVSALFTALFLILVGPVVGAATAAAHALFVG